MARSATLAPRPPGSQGASSGERRPAAPLHTFLLAAIAISILGLASGAAGVLVAAPGAGAPAVRLGQSIMPFPRVAPPANRGEIRIAVAAFLSPRRSLTAYEKLIDLLGSRLGRPVRLVQRRSYAEINDLILSGAAAAGFVCSGAYVAAEDQGLELLAAPVARGEPGLRSYLIVPTESPATSFEDLKGRPVALMDRLSLTGCLYPSALAAERGLTPEEYFGRILWTCSHEGSIEAVARGLVDGAAVHGRVYEYVRARDPELIGRTRIVARSPVFAAEPVVASPRAPPELKAALRETLLALSETDEGRAALADLAIERFEDTRSDRYASVRALRAKLARAGERR